MKQKLCERKWAVCEVNCEPFDKCKCFVSGILFLNKLNSKVKKLKHYFEKKLIRKGCFP